MDADKPLIQSHKIVTKAMSVFAQAIAEIEKANEVLRKGVEQDTQAIENIIKQVDDLHAKRVILQESKAAKLAEISKNEELIQKLKEFTN